MVFAAEPPEPPPPAPWRRRSPAALRLVDQLHGALAHLLRGEEIVVGARDHVDDGVADAENVETSCGHGIPLDEWSGKARRTIPADALEAIACRQWMTSAGGSPLESASGGHASCRLRATSPRSAARRSLSRLLGFVRDMGIAARARRRRLLRRLLRGPADRQLLPAPAGRGRAQCRLRADVAADQAGAKARAAPPILPRGAGARCCSRSARSR